MKTPSLHKLIKHSKALTEEQKSALLKIGKHLSQQAREKLINILEGEQSVLKTFPQLHKLSQKKLHEELGNIINQAIRRTHKKQKRMMKKK